MQFPSRLSPLREGEWRSPRESFPHFTLIFRLICRELWLTRFFPNFQGAEILLCGERRVGEPTALRPLAIGRGGTRSGRYERRTIVHFRNSGDQREVFGERMNKNMLKAGTTVSPLFPPSRTTPPPLSVLRITSAIASTADYAIDQMMLKEDEEQLNMGEKYVPYEDRPETYIVPIVFLLILLIGLTGNGVLALTILRHSNMRNVPNIYVFSLALGDLLARVHSLSW